MDRHALPPAAESRGYVRVIALVAMLVMVTIGALAAVFRMNEPPAQPGSVRSVWRGSYVCAQGETALRFSATRICGRGENEEPTTPCRIAGTFDFGPLPQNPSVPHGQYRITGTMVENAHGELAFSVVPDAWIERPANYFMVGFNAVTEGGHHVLRGTIDNPSCGAVVVERVE